MIELLFKGTKEIKGWTAVEYSATWRYGYDFMLDAAQVVIDTDFQDKLQRVAVSNIVGGKDREMLDEAAAHKNILRDCPEIQEENGTLTISGISRLMECPIQLIFFNQTNVVRLLCPFKKYFEEHGEHVFDNYMNSIEIMAYCRDTERRTKESFLKNE